MSVLKIHVNTSAAKSLFRKDLPAALPYIKAAMLTNLAAKGRDAVQSQMPVAFDAPTPFTVRGVWFKSATKSNLVAEVYVPQSESQGGTAKRGYLQPGVAGSGARRQKKTEFLLSRTGFLPAGWVTTPGSTTGKIGMIDSFGNLSGRIYAQVINVLQIKRAATKSARGISARSQKRATKMGVQSEWFAVAPGKNSLAKGGGWLPPGVYRRAGKSGEQLQQILRFVPRAGYRPRLDFDGIVQRSVGQNAQTAFDSAMASVKKRFVANAKR